MAKGEFDYSMRLVAVVAFVAVVGLISVMGGWQGRGLHDSLTANVVSEAKEEVKISPIINPVEELENLPEPAYVYIMPDSQSVKNGADVMVGVNIAGVNNLYAFQFDISYDPAVLEFVQEQQGNWLTNNGKDSIYCIPQTASSGLITNLACTRLGIIDGLSSNGVLETLAFKAVSKGESAIVLQNLKLSDPNSVRITASNINGRIIVK
jgi:hypothetical protein